MGHGSLPLSWADRFARWWYTTGNFSYYYLVLLLCHEGVLGTRKIEEIFTLSLTYGNSMHTQEIYHITNINFSSPFPIKLPKNLMEINIPGLAEPQPFIFKLHQKLLIPWAVNKRFLWGCWSHRYIPGSASYFFKYLSFILSSDIKKKAHNQTHLSLHLNTADILAKRTLKKWILWLFGNW